MLGFVWFFVQIGQGTYSNVYKAKDLISGKIVALKKVRFDNLEPESVKFMAREILVLRKLDHPNVVKLEGLVTSRMSCSLYLVFEYMEHDLAGLVACQGLKFTEPQVCFFFTLLVMNFVIVELIGSWVCMRFRFGFFMFLCFWVYCRFFYFLDWLV